MKKFIIAIIIMFIVIGTTSDMVLHAKKILFGEPTTHTIQQGEYLSKIAKEYYGDAKYWRELALINRAPNSNKVFPGEEIIVPRKDIILSIRKSKCLSDVNTYVHGEQEILAKITTESKEPDININPVINTELDTPPKADTDAGNNETFEEPTIKEESGPIHRPVQINEPLKSSTLPMVLGGITTFIVISLFSLIFLRRKKKLDQIVIVDDIDTSEYQPDFDSLTESEEIEAKKEEEIMQIN